MNLYLCFVVLIYGWCVSFNLIEILKHGKNQNAFFKLNFKNVLNSNVFWKFIYLNK